MGDTMGSRNWPGLCESASITSSGEVELARAIDRESWKKKKKEAIRKENAKGEEELKQESEKQKEKKKKIKEGNSKRIELEQGRQRKKRIHIAGIETNEISREVK